MARKEDIQASGAAKILSGLARDLAAAVRDRADAFLSEASDPKAIDRELRTINHIARAASSVQTLQAAEDKADARAQEAKAQRALARVRAQKTHQQRGETRRTCMSETQDLKIPTPWLRYLQRSDGAWIDWPRLIEEKTTAEAPCRRGGAGDADALGRAGAPGPAPTH